MKCEISYISIRRTRLLNRMAQDLLACTNYYSALLSTSYYETNLIVRRREKRFEE
jgi:hypothetical protein